MNRATSGLQLSKAITGFIQYKAAEGLRPRSLYSYERTLNNWVEFSGDIGIDKISAQDIRSYLAWLRTEYQPRRWNGKKHPLSAKTVRNIWVTISSFFTWACLEFDIPNPMKKVPGPRYQRAPVEPFSRTELEALLQVCDYSRKADTHYRSTFRMRRPTAHRDRAIILTLLDTGLRSSELCALTIGDLDSKTGRLEVKHGSLGGAKGARGRTVFLGKATRRAVWRYLVEREDGEEAGAPLFLGKYHRPMNPNSLRQLIVALGDKAQVKKCHPHRFRHIFAITYLRAGGDVFTLQALLGHNSLEMVKHYARIAEIDIRDAHRRASPADKWRL